MGMVKWIFSRKSCGRKGRKMIRIGQVKLKTGHSKEDLYRKTEKILGVTEEDIESLEIHKRSLDARKKPELFFVYTVDVSLKYPKKEKKILKRMEKKKDICEVQKEDYQFPKKKDGDCRKERPVVIGSGPAGMFCAYMLAVSGYRPVLIERGAMVEERKKDVEEFWKTGVLNTVSNVQFGEGGAGTFSDGKLNTLVKDPRGIGRKVLKIFTEHGAPEEILYENKPHIGTDVLIDVVKNMRLSIEDAGGTCLFHTKMTGLEVKDGILKGVWISKEGKEELLKTDTAVLAIGHSARDTFKILYEQGIPMEPKSFAVGVRTEHLQSMINESQYGTKSHPHLPAAAYKLTAKAGNGRGVYTFCMCPGGYVVNASSEEGRLCVNGMSYHDRGGKNANSAVIVTVTPEDYKGEQELTPLSGVEFQRKLEEKAYLAGKGKIPVQCFGDFCENKISDSFGEVLPQMKGAYCFGDVRGIFPEEIAESIQEGMFQFDRKIHGFANKDTVLSGVEARTSSPLRILRDETMQSIKIKGLYPCGEGAGYAGGITSAAMDGIKVAESIAYSKSK